MKILLVHHINNSFIDTDYEILKKHYEVVDFKYKGIRSIPSLFRKMRDCDVIISWFMSLHTLPTTLSNKFKIYIAGGYDAANVPEIDYGMANRFYTRWIVKWCLMRADRVVAVSKYNKLDLNRNYGYGKASVIYNTTSNNIHRYNIEKDKNLILTIGSVNNETMSRKGIRDFCRLAEYCHKQGDTFKFVVVGRIDSNVMSEVEKWCMKTPNLLFTDYIPNKKLLYYLNKAKVYCQLSKYESFGVSLLEAMKCECIPVINSVTALPEVTRGHGFCINPEDLDDVRNKVIDATKSQDGMKVRESTNFFSLKKREKELMRLINECLG